jgi:hypothetical protein
MNSLVPSRNEAVREGAAVAMRAALEGCFVTAAGAGVRPLGGGGLLV